MNSWGASREGKESLILLAHITLQRLTYKRTRVSQNSRMKAALILLLGLGLVAAATAAPSPQPGCPIAAAQADKLNYAPVKAVSPCEGSKRKRQQLH